MFSEESFNAMVLARKGKLPVNVICVDCPDDETLGAFIRKNKTFYESLGLKVKGLVHTEFTKREDNELIFVTDKNTKYPHFNLLLKKDVPISRFIEELNLDGLTEDVLKGLECFDYLSKTLTSEEGYNTAVISTLERHFCTSTDNQFKESDFDWCVPRAKTNVGMSISNKAGFINDVEAKPVVENTPNKAGDNEVACEDKTEVTPAPTENDEDVCENKGVETLSVEEIAENTELLKKIREAYEDAKKAIEESCNSLFVPIKNHIKNALESNDFTSQLCVMYLEVSQDVSTVVYKKLYDADTMAETFNNNLHRQTLKMGCPGCNHQWYEDITFLEDGIHEIHCPKCNLSRLIEK